MEILTLYCTRYPTYLPGTLNLASVERPEENKRGEKSLLSGSDLLVLVFDGPFSSQCLQSCFLLKITFLVRFYSANSQAEHYFMVLF